VNLLVVPNTDGDGIHLSNVSILKKAERIEDIYVSKADLEESKQ